MVSKGGGDALFGQVLGVVREIKRVLSFQGGGVMLENEDMLIVQEREYAFDCIGISLEVFDGRIEGFYPTRLNSSSRDEYGKISTIIRIHFWIIVALIFSSPLRVDNCGVAYDLTNSGL